MERPQVISSINSHTKQFDNNKRGRSPLLSVRISNNPEISSLQNLRKNKKTILKSQSHPLKRMRPSRRNSKKTNMSSPDMQRSLSSSYRPGDSRLTSVLIIKEKDGCRSSKARFSEAIYRGRGFDSTIGAKVRPVSSHSSPPGVLYKRTGLGGSPQKRKITSAPPSPTIPRSPRIIKKRKPHCKNVYGYPLYKPQIIDPHYEVSERLLRPNRRDHCSNVIRETESPGPRPIRKFIPPRRISQNSKYSGFPILETELRKDRHKKCKMTRTFEERELENFQKELENFKKKKEIIEAEHRRLVIPMKHPIPQKRKCESALEVIWGDDERGDGLYFAFPLYDTQHRVSRCDTLKDMKPKIMKKESSYSPKNHKPGPAFFATKKIQSKPTTPKNRPKEKKKETKVPKPSPDLWWMNPPDELDYKKQEIKIKEKKPVAQRKSHSRSFNSKPSTLNKSKGGGKGDNIEIDDIVLSKSPSPYVLERNKWSADTGGRKIFKEIQKKEEEDEKLSIFLESDQKKKKNPNIYAKSQKSIARSRADTIFQGKDFKRISIKDDDFSSESASEDKGIIHETGMNLQTDSDKKSLTQKRSQMSAFSSDVTSQKTRMTQKYDHVESVIAQYISSDRPASPNSRKKIEFLEEQRTIRSQKINSSRSRSGTEETTAQSRILKKSKRPKTISPPKGLSPKVFTNNSHQNHQSRERSLSHSPFKNNIKEIDKLTNKIKDHILLKAPSIEDIVPSDTISKEGIILQYPHREDIVPSDTISKEGIILQYPHRSHQLQNHTVPILQYGIKQNNDYGNPNLQTMNQSSSNSNLRSHLPSMNQSSSNSNLRSHLPSMNQSSSNSNLRSHEPQTNIRSPTISPNYSPSSQSTFQSKSPHPQQNVPRAHNVHHENNNNNNNTNVCCIHPDTKSLHDTNNVHNQKSNPSNSISLKKDVQTAPHDQSPKSYQSSPNNKETISNQKKIFSTTASPQSSKNNDQFIKTNKEQNRTSSSESPKKRRSFGVFETKRRSRIENEQNNDTTDDQKRTESSPPKRKFTSLQYSPTSEKLLYMKNDQLFNNKKEKDMEQESTELSKKLINENIIQSESPPTRKFGSLQNTKTQYHSNNSNNNNSNTTVTITNQSFLNDTLSNKKLEENELYDHNKNSPQLPVSFPQESTPSYNFSTPTYPSDHLVTHNDIYQTSSQPNYIPTSPSSPQSSYHHIYQTSHNINTVTPSYEIRREVPELNIDGSVSNIVTRNLDNILSHHIKNFEKSFSFQPHGIIRTLSDPELFSEYKRRYIDRPVYSDGEENIVVCSKESLKESFKPKQSSVNIKKQNPLVDSNLPFVQNNSHTLASRLILKDPPPLGEDFLTISPFIFHNPNIGTDRKLESTLPQSNVSPLLEINPVSQSPRVRNNQQESIVSVYPERYRDDTSLQQRIQSPNHMSTHRSIGMGDGVKSKISPRLGSVATDRNIVNSSIFSPQVHMTISNSQTPIVSPIEVETTGIVALNQIRSANHSPEMIGRSPLNPIRTGLEISSPRQICPPQVSHDVAIRSTNRLMEGISPRSPLDTPLPPIYDCSPSRSIPSYPSGPEQKLFSLQSTLDTGGPQQRSLQSTLDTGGPQAIGTLLRGVQLDSSPHGGQRVLSPKQTFRPNRDNISNPSSPHSFRPIRDIDNVSNSSYNHILDASNPLSSPKVQYRKVTASSDPIRLQTDINKHSVFAGPSNPLTTPVERFPDVYRQKDDGVPELKQLQSELVGPRARSPLRKHTIDTNAYNGIRSNQNNVIHPNNQINGIRPSNQIDSIRPPTLERVSNDPSTITKNSTPLISSDNSNNNGIGLLNYEGVASFSGNTSKRANLEMGIGKDRMDPISHIGNTTIPTRDIFRPSYSVALTKEPDETIVSKRMPLLQNQNTRKIPTRSLSHKIKEQNLHYENQYGEEGYDDYHRNKMERGNTYENNRSKVQYSNNRSGKFNEQLHGSIHFRPVKQKPGYDQIPDRIDHRLLDDRYSMSAISNNNRQGNYVLSYDDNSPVTPHHVPSHNVQIPSRPGYVNHNRNDHVPKAVYLDEDQNPGLKIKKRQINDEGSYGPRMERESHKIYHQQNFDPRTGQPSSVAAQHAIHADKNPPQQHYQAAGRPIVKKKQNSVRSLKSKVSFAPIP